MQVWHISIGTNTHSHECSRRWYKAMSKPELCGRKQRGEEWKCMTLKANKKQPQQHNFIPSIKCCFTHTCLISQHLLLIRWTTYVKACVREYVHDVLNNQKQNKCETYRKRIWTKTVTVENDDDAGDERNESKELTQTHSINTTSNDNNHYRWK